MKEMQTDVACLTLALNARQLLNRQALLGYGREPQSAFDYLWRELNLMFGHVRKTDERASRAPSSLDDGLLAAEKLAALVLGEPKSLSRVSDEGLAFATGLGHFTNETAAATGRVFIAKTPELFTHDPDGNLLSDGRFTYTWNGENRLAAAETRDDLPPEIPRHRVTYAYDHQGRMVLKEVFDVANNCKLKTNHYLWDGWNIIRETTTDHLPPATNHCSYVWGLDLSGTLQDAGGVGGLLAVHKDGAAFLPAYDANGNITEYVGPGGAVAAHYGYDAFGNTVAQSDTMPDAFAFRFSTKPWCSVFNKTGYQLRIYDPVTASWMTRDPIEEWGGMNLYGFAGNVLVNRIDWLGMSWWNPFSRFPGSRELPYESAEDQKNCLGFASGKGGSIRSKEGRSLKEVTEALGFTCKGPTKGECKGGDCEDVMVVYIYKNGNFPKGANPWRTPWIHDPDNNDYHAIKREKMKTGYQWWHVEGNHPKRSNEVTPDFTSDPTDPDSFWKGAVPEDRYCCRKKKGNKK